MPINITIPSPGESITEVTVGAWHKRSGEWVAKDEPLVEIESDKVTMEIPAPDSGVLKIAAESGAEKKVGDTVGSIEPSPPKPPPTDGVSGDGKAAAPSKPKAKPADDHASRSAAKVEAATESAAAEATRATPVARKMAAEKGVDLAKVQGTGPAGRIRKADILAAASAPAKPAPASQPVSKSVGPAAQVVAISSAGHRGARREKMTKLRQRIAERLVAAQHNAAMLTTFNEADMGEVMRLRTTHKEDFEKRYGIGLGFMSFFVR